MHRTFLVLPGRRMLRGWRACSGALTKYNKSCSLTGRGAPSLRAPVLASCLSSMAVEDGQQQPLFTIDPKVLTFRLEKFLEQRNAEEAWRALQKLKRAGVDFPERQLIRECLALFSGGDTLCLLRAHKIMSRLNKDDKLDYLDGDLLKSLSMSFAEGEMYDLSASAFRLMLQKYHHPPLAFWKTLLGSWLQSPRGAFYVVKVFLEICRYCCTASPEHQAHVSPDKEAFTIALKACAALGESGKAEEIMKQMSRFSLRPDNACFCALMKAHEKGGGIELMLKVLLRMRQAQEVPSRTTLNSLLTACVNIGEVDVAAQVVLCWSGKVKDGIQESGVSKDTVHYKLQESIKGWRGALEIPCGETFALLLKAFLQKNRVADAATFLGKLYSAEDSQYIPCSFALDGVLQLGLRDEINGTLQELAIQNTPADSMSYAMLVKAYCKLPQPLKAEAVLQDARRAGHLLDIACYAAVIDAYNLIQDYDCAQRVFRDMKRHGVVPLEPILNKLLSFFEKHGKPYLMFKLLEAASRDPPLKLELQHWNRTVQSFCKGKLLFDAKAVVKRMKQAGFDPDANTYVFLLSGYILMGNKTNEILLLWAEIKEKLASTSSHSHTGQETGTWNGLRQRSEMIIPCDKRVCTMGERGNMGQKFPAIPPSPGPNMAIPCDHVSETHTPGRPSTRAPLKLNEELLNGFLTIFVKYGYFKNALDVIARMEERKFWADKQKYKNMYWHLHKDLYTSKHRSQRRVDMSQERRKQVDTFKTWVGLPT